MARRGIEERGSSAQSGLMGVGIQEDKGSRTTWHIKDVKENREKERFPLEVLCIASGETARRKLLKSRM